MTRIVATHPRIGIVMRPATMFERAVFLAQPARTAVQVGAFVIEEREEEPSTPSDGPCFWYDGAGHPHWYGEVTS